MAAIHLSLTDEQRALKAGVTEICKRYPGEYWRDLDSRREYPEKFVNELTQAGYLACLIPPEYGGAGLRHGRGRHDPRDHPRQRRQRLGVPRPDVHHGHRAAARQRGPEAALPAEDRHRRPAAAGLRRHRAGRRLGYHAAQDHRGAQGRSLRGQWPEDVHLARDADRPHAAAGPHHAGGPGEAPDRRAQRLPGRHPVDQGPGDPAAQDDDEPLHQRPVLRRHGGPRRQRWWEKRARAFSTSCRA